MERLDRLLALIPELYAQGLLDASGGNVAVRTSQGVHVSPAQAGELLRWKVRAEDFVLFPGDSDASMARAGRRPSRENRLHRAVLNLRRDWNFSYHGHSWGVLGFALPGRALPVSAHFAHLLRHGKALEIPVVPPIPSGLPQLAEAVVEAISSTFAGCTHGAVLLGGHGLLVAGAEVESTLALVTALEGVARAQLWQLASR
jgi:ribulose-5-phosphate 4-epimerase/fuculose-1-phosphate aldolase